MYNATSACVMRHFGQVVTAYDLDFDGRAIIVTTGTGDGIYAYDERAVAAWLAGAPGDYTDFCSRVTPISGAAVSQAVADADFGWGEGRGCGYGPLRLS